MKLKYTDSTNTINEQLKRELNQAHEKREILQRDFEQAIQKHELKLQQESRARANLINDKKELQLKIQ